MRESEYYRDVLEDILTMMNGKRMLTIKDVCNYTGLNRATVEKRYPFVDHYIAAPVLARQLSIHK